MRTLKAFALSIALLGPVAAPAGAETLAQLRSEISALSTIVADLAQELSSGEAAQAEAGFDGSLIDRVERIREELSRLTARSEEMEYRIRRVVDDASNRIGDIEFRLTELEGGDPTDLPATRPLGGGAFAEPAGDAPQLAEGEQAAFDAAKALIERGEMSEAASALSVFLETYPGSPLGPQASLALAETQREMGAEADAARSYLNLYLSDTTGPHAPVALLELGQSLARLDQRSEACVMFEELRQNFPDSTQAEVAEQAGTELACF